MNSSKVQLLSGIMEEIEWIFTNKKLIFVLTASSVPKSCLNLLVLSTALWKSLQPGQKKRDLYWPLTTPIC